MAASDARPVPRKNVAYRVTFPIRDNDGDLVTGAAGLDSEISRDGVAFIDATNEATELASSSGMYYLELTASEMNADTVAIIVKTSTTDAKTTPIVMYPEEVGDFRADVRQWMGSEPLGLRNQRVDGYLGDTASFVITASTLAADTIQAAKILDGAITEPKIASGALTNAKFANFALTTSTLSENVYHTIADHILDRTDGVMTGYTVRRILRLLAAAEAGKISGAGTSTITIRNLLDTKNAIIASVDADGNRLTITLDLS